MHSFLKCSFILISDEFQNMFQIEIDQSTCLQWQCLVRASVIFEACSTESCWKGSGTKWLSKNTLSNNSSQIRWLTRTRHHANSRFIILHNDITQPALERSSANISLFFPLFGFISVSLTHGDSSQCERNSWMSWNFRKLSRHLIAECQSLFSDTTLNLQLWQRHSSGALPLRSTRVCAPVRDFTSHTNSRELQKAPNEALMEAVYALSGLFVVVVFTLFVDSFQTLFSAFHIFFS